METKVNYANLTTAASVLMLCAATVILCFAIYILSNSRNNNHYGFIGGNGDGGSTAFPRDNSDIIPIETALKFYNNVAEADTPFGAWIGRDLLLAFLIAKNDDESPKYTGIHVFRGIEIIGTDSLNVFMITGGHEKKGTYLPVRNNAFYKLDAMCPKICDGMTRNDN